MAELIADEVMTPDMVHQGRNRTCCWGRCFVNAEPARCVLTLLMINLPVVAILALSFSEIFVDSFYDFESFSWVVATFLLVYLTAAANYNMIWCASTDPGIMPARRWPYYVADKYDEPRDKTDFYTQFWAVNQREQGHLYKLTFCKTCQIFQPPRCHHCPFCKTCVLELDHHCMWLGTCLGLRNYHSFYWFLLNLGVLVICQLIFVGCYMWRLTVKREQTGETLDTIFGWHEWIGFPLVCIFNCLVGKFVCDQWWLHSSQVASKGVTVYELIKMEHRYLLFAPHKRGSSCSNFCRMVCCARRVLDSRLDYRLQVASEKKHFSAQELRQLQEGGIIEPEVREDTVFSDQLPEDYYHTHQQVDMNECELWQLAFMSRKQARGNLRTFQRIRKQSVPQQNNGVSPRQFQSGQKLLPDAYMNDFRGDVVYPGSIVPEIYDQHHASTSSNQHQRQAVGGFDPSDDPYADVSVDQ